MNTKQIGKVLLVSAVCLSGALAEDKSTAIRNATCKMYEDIAEVDNNDKSYQKINYFKSDKVQSAKDKAKNMAEDRTYLRDRFVEDKINDEEFFQEVAWDVAPFAVFAVLSLLGFITYMCCFCCDLCCPGIICCKKKNTYSGFEKIWPVLGSFIFCCAVIVTGIVGAVYGSSFDEGYYMFKCQIMGFLDDFNVGNFEDKDSEWIGLNGLDLELKKVKDDLIQQAQQTFEQSPWIEDQYTQVQEQQKLLWNPDRDSNTINELADNEEYQYTQKVGYNPDPTNGVSVFYNDGWNQAVSTFTSIVTDTLDGLKQGMSDTNEQGLAMTEDEFGKAIDDGRKEIKDLVKQINDAASDIDDSTSDVDDNLPDIKDYIQYYFYASLGAGALGIVSLLLVAVFRLRKFRFFMHISWCVFSIFMLVGFIIGTVLWGVSSLGFQSCQIIENVLEDYSELKKLDILDGEILVYIRTCKEEYKGNGNILEEFGVTEQLDTVTKLQEEMNESLVKFDEGQSELQRLTDELNSTETKLQELRDEGTVEGAPENLLQDSDSDDRADILVGTCNNVLRQNSQDSNCSNYQSGWPTTGGYQNGDNCLNYNTFVNVNMDYCGVNGAGTNEKSPELVNLLLWVQEKNSITDEHITVLTDYNDLVEDYINKTTDWFTKVEDFNSVSISNILNDIKVVVNERSNCLFLGRNIDKIHGGFCIELIPGIYDMTIVLLTHCFAMFLGSFFLYIVGFRYAQFDRQQKYKEAKEKDDAYERTGEPVPQ